MQTLNTTQQILTIKRAARVIRALNHYLRQQILSLIKSNGEMTVSGIYKELGLEQSVASQHLAILRDAGLVKTQRDGKHIFYSVNQTGIERTLELCSALNAIKTTAF